MKPFLCLIFILLNAVAAAQETLDRLGPFKIGMHYSDFCGELYKLNKNCTQYNSFTEEMRSNYYDRFTVNAGTLKMGEDENGNSYRSPFAPYDTLQKVANGSFNYNNMLFHDVVFGFYEDTLISITCLMIPMDFLEIIKAKYGPGHRSIKEYPFKCNSDKAADLTESKEKIRWGTIIIAEYIKSLSYNLQCQPKVTKTFRIEDKAKNNIATNRNNSFKQIAETKFHAEQSQKF